jgi:hypothetical protein
MGENDIIKKCSTAAMFGGLVVKPELIRTILRSELMKESAQQELSQSRLKKDPSIATEVKVN